MRDEDIHIGDVLYIKEWDELIKEGHLNSDGNIEFTFDSTEHTRTVILLKDLFIDKCGSQFTVKSVIQNLSEYFMNQRKIVNIEHSQYG